MLLKKSLIVLCCLFSSTAFAERWFEVEVLVLNSALPRIYKKTLALSTKLLKIKIR